MIGLNDIVQEITGNYEQVLKVYLFPSTVHDRVKWDRTGNDEKVYLTQ